MSIEVRNRCGPAALTPPFADPAVDLGRLLLVGGPEGRVLLRPQLGDRLALLLHPGEVLLVVPAAAGLGRPLDEPARLGLAEDVQAAAGLVLRHRPALAVELAQHRRIAVEAVGGDGDDGLARPQAEVARGL